MARRSSTYRVMAVIWIVAVVAVVAAFLFAPRRPQAPPPSQVSYEQKPGDAPARSSESLFPRPEREPPLARLSNEPDKEIGGQFRIYGTVSDAQTGTPLPNAFVRCVRKRAQAEEDAWLERSAQLAAGKEKIDAERKDEGGRESHVRTDKEGQYSIRVDQPGEYVFSVHLMGYLAVRDKTGTLEAQPGELRMDFELASGARISGRVTESSSGKGAPGVKVRCEGASNEEAECDDDGRYVLAGLLPGNYAVMLDLKQTPYMSEGVIPSRNVSIGTPTQEVKGVDFSVQSAGTVWGYVMTQNREPIKDANVFLCSVASVVSQIIEAGIKKSEPLHDESENNGYYEIMGVPLGREWRLYATQEKQAPQLSDAFILTSAQKTARVDIFLPTGSSVYGYVISAADQQPISGADVACIPSYSKFFSAFDAPQAFRGAHSKDDGSFAIESLPVGEYQLLARKRGYKFSATGEPVYPDGFSDIKNVELVLTPVEGGEGQVYGTVQDSAGRPIADASLSLAYVGIEDLDGGDMRTRSDVGGRYAFDGVTDGVLILTASKKGYETKTVTEVRLNEPTDVILAAGASVSGVVLVKETNQPVERFTVYAVRTMSSNGEIFPQMLDDMSRVSTSGTNGKFTLAVSGGDYTIIARASGLTPGQTSVSVDDGENATGVTIYMRNSGGRIAGTVTTTDKRSPAGALVWLSEDTGTSLTLAGIGEGTTGIQVGEDGAFEFSNLAAGTYTIQAKLEGYAQTTTAPMDLGDGQAMTGVQVVLTTGSSLEGTVSFDGRLTSGAMVTVIGNQVTEMTTSDADGHYQFERLAAGTYLASAVSFQGGTVMGLFSPLHARVEIVEGQTTVCNFGETTDTALVGYCTPAPAGKMGYALLVAPDAPIDLGSLNLMNPASWFTQGSALAGYIMGMAPVESDGFFRIDNLVSGQYTLYVLYGGVSNIFSGTLTQVGAASVIVAPGQVTEVQVAVMGG